MLAFFGLPLFVSLGQEDLRNDEAIYSYSVDRMLETGDWLTPRAIPFDGPFLEKPPLKVWIVAALIGSGLVPHDEWGLRSADALFGAIAFLYVYALGCLLAGPICGVAAVVVLFGLGPLLLGLRSNNMEAGLVLAYAGGLYHFARWDALSASKAPPWNTEHAFKTSNRRRAAHGLAVGAYFALGFMLKFVAVLFLPLICAFALLWRDRRSRPRLRDLSRAWLGPTALAVALCAPWFIAASLEHGRHLWDVMFGAHVYTRLTGALDPTHLAPWTAYIEWTWGDLLRAQTARFVVPGLLLLLFSAFIRRSLQGDQDAEPRRRLARLVLLWLIVPLTVMSMGTSKLSHYAYPFLPPLGLAAGYLIATLATFITGPMAAMTLRWVRSFAHAARVPRALTMARGALVIGGVVALAVALWTVIDGRILWNMAGGVQLSNASIARPLILGAFLVWLGASPLSTLHAWVVVPLIVISVAPRYEGVIEGLRRPDRPLSTLRACALEVQRGGPNVDRGVYNAARGIVSHPFFYYLRSLGPWTWADAPSEEEIRRRLIEREEESPMFVSREGFATLMSTLSPQPTPGLARASLDDEKIRSRQTPVIGVTDRDRHVIVVLPGPYQTCVPPVVAAGWIAVGDSTTTGGDR